MTFELQGSFDSKDGPSVGGMRVNKHLRYQKTHYQLDRDQQTVYYNHLLLSGPIEKQRGTEETRLAESTNQLQAEEAKAKQKEYERFI